MPAWNERKRNQRFALMESGRTILAFLFCTGVWRFRFFNFFLLRVSLRADFFLSPFHRFFPLKNRIIILSLNSSSFCLLFEAEHCACTIVRSWKYAYVYRHKATLCFTLTLIHSMPFPLFPKRSRTWKFIVHLTLKRGVFTSEVLFFLEVYFSKYP